MRFSQQFWNRLNDFLGDLHKHHSLDEVSYVIANDLATILECERVTVLVRRGRSVRVVAVSGEESIERRSPAIRRAEELATHAMTLRCPITQRDSFDSEDEDVMVALADYVAENQSRFLAVMPMLDDNSDEGLTTEPVGCLICERSSSSEGPLNFEKRIDILAPHVANAVTTAVREETMLFRPTLIRLGRFQRWFSGRKIAAFCGIMATLGLLMLWAAAVRVHYTFRVDGRILPANRHFVFAPMDGDVLEVVVKDGERVEASQLLFRLSSDELESKRILLENEVGEKEKLVASLRGRLDRAGNSPDQNDAIEAEGDYVREKLALESVVRQLALLTVNIERLNVRSPIGGVVVTADVEQSLIGRPVNRGEVLLEVMQTNGDWILELVVPDFRMGHLMKAAESGVVPVKYVVANAVENELSGRLQKIGGRTYVSADAGTYIRVTVEIDKSDLRTELIGADVSASVVCGECSLLYYAFGDVYEFLLRKL